MRAAAIFGLGCSPKLLEPFQEIKSDMREVEWRIGLPASHDEADIILLFGGDGTIHRHLGRLVKLAIPVLIVPSGSGNDFAKALGFRRVRDSLAAWSRYCSDEENVRAIDLGVITSASTDGSLAPARNSEPENNSYFCSVAGLGLGSEVTRRANGLPRWVRARGGYVLALGSTVFRFAPFPMKILTQDATASWSTRSDRPTMLAAFANSPAYGSGMKIAPTAKMDDGLLDVCVIGGIDPFKLACMFPTIYFGKHIGIRQVDYFTAVRIRVETEKPLEVYADGEYVCRTPIEVSVHGAALKVLTP
jgi:diacylglycerol kinase (ATP)